jgi:hypothetical protein
MPRWRDLTVAVAYLLFFAIPTGFLVAGWFGVLPVLFLFVGGPLLILATLGGSVWTAPRSGGFRSRLPAQRSTCRRCGRGVVMQRNIGYCTGCGRPAVGCVCP